MRVVVNSSMRHALVLAVTAALVLACSSSQATPTPGATGPAPTATGPVVTAAPTPTAAPVGPTGTLTVMVADLSNERFDPAFESGGQGGRNYGRLLGGYLLAQTPAGDLIPGIASEWGLSEDGLTWTFTIRDGVKFHDGSDLTAEDVAWTLQHYFSADALEYVTGQAARFAEVMDSIEVVDGDKVAVTTTELALDFPFFVSEASTGWYPIMPKRDALHDEAAESAYDEAPIGAGPMKLVAHTPGDHMTFERFDDFYFQPDNGFEQDRRPSFKQLDLLVVPEEATRVSALQAGDADIIPASLAAKTQIEGSGGRMVFVPEGQFLDVQIQGCWSDEHPCHDKGVRQALDFDVNKEELRDELFGGTDVFRTDGWSIATPSAFGWTPSLTPRPYDPDMARQLFETAGYPGGAGFGPLMINVRQGSVIPFLVESAQLIADTWHTDLGLDVTVRELESSTFKDMLNAGELDGSVTLQENGTSADPSCSIGSKYDPEDQTSGLRDEALFDMIKTVCTTIDQDQRKALAEQEWETLKDATYHVGIGYFNVPWGVGPAVATWEPYPQQGFLTAIYTITLQ